MIYIDRNFRFYDDSQDLEIFPDLRPVPGAVALTDQEVADISADITRWRWHPTENRPYKIPDCDPMYHKEVGGVIVEMTPAEKAAVDAAAAQRRLDIARLAKLDAVNALRDQKIAAGVPFVFPDGAGTVQTRDVVDARNVQTNVTMAMILAGQGVTSPVMSFRDQEDAIHSMTPAQMIQMGVAVADHGQAIYTASWSHKDAITALQTLADVEGYDITTGWPA